MDEFDLENPLVVQDDGDSLGPLLAAEPHHMCGGGCGGLELSARRRDAATLILKAQYACNLDPSTTYLAVNYLDRFLSKREIPTGKPWIARLLSIACVSLASKMLRTAASPVADLQSEEGLVFDAERIGQMEMLVLGALEWRMRSITPFAFLRFFAALFSPAQPPLLAALESQARLTLYKAQNEIKMLRFRPSVAAAAALLSAAHELFPVQFEAFRSALAASVDRESLRECYDTMRDVAAADGCDERISSCDTPVTVLWRHQYTSSFDSDPTVGSTAADPGIKKRRVSGGGGAARPPPPYF